MKQGGKGRSPAQSQAGFKPRGRIVFTLAAVLVLIGLAPLCAVAWKSISNNRVLLKTSQQEFQLLLALSIAEEMDIHVDGLEAAVLRVAQALGGAMRSSGDSSADTRKILGHLVDDRMPYLRYTYFRGGWVGTLDVGALPQSLEPMFAAGVEETAEILSEAVQSRAEYALVSEPILISAVPARTVLVISAPVVSGGKFRGVLSALVDVQPVWDAVVSRNPQGHQIFACDPGGRIIAATHTSGVRPGDLADSSELVRRFLIQGGRQTIPFNAEVGASSEEMLGSFVQSQHKWGIFVQTPARQIYSPVRQMIEGVLTWAGAVVLVAVLAAFVFAGTLSNPIKRLVAASRAFAAGDFAARVEVASGNEIGELAYTFNKMAGEIEDHIRRLRRAAEENEELFLGTIRALAQAIDAKDPYTKGHSIRVNRYTVVLARELGLSPEELYEIHVASLLHDVGKIGIDDHILKKPGKLTDEEFGIMKTHTVLGANIMAPIAKMQRMLPGLRSHHERWGGGGYPDGLAHDQIPRMARIIAVADAFDAMTTHRPYQQAMTFEAAHRRINELKAVAFQENVVEAFNRVYERGELHAEANAPDVPQPIRPVEAARYVSGR